jgi:anti-sigma factor RsiW
MTADRGGDRHVRRLLGAYALDVLPADESRGVQVHLRRCDECAEAYAEMADAVCMLALVSEDDLLE